MAKNKVEIDVKVDDKGTTKKLGLQSKKAAKGLEDTAKSARTADRNLKGTAQASSNTTKNFSKMAQGTGGLVAAYATLAANIFAISAAFQFLKRAGDLRALEAAQEQYARKTGLSMRLLTSRIQDATGGIVSFQEASQAAAIGVAAGLSPDQLERLGRAAKNAGAALGRDTTDAFQRLTRGAIKAEPELLDELGIIVRLEKATTDYKNALNITGRELTTFEKTQAVVNATLAQAEEKFDDVGDSVNEIARLGKAFDDLVKAIQTTLVGPAEFLAKVFTKNIFALGAAFTLLGVNIMKSLAPAGPMIEDLSAAADDAKKRVRAAVSSGSATGRAVAGGDFSANNMKRLRQSVNAQNSTVIEGSREMRQALKSDLDIIEAEHHMTMQHMAKGHGKFTAKFLANLKLMQAQHGRTMGALKFGFQQMASFASKVMNTIAIIGVITLAISLGKEMLNLLKSKELKDAEARAERLQSRFKEQNTAVHNMLTDLRDAKEPMSELARNANMISQLSMEGFVASIQSIPQIGLGQFSMTGPNTVDYRGKEQLDAAKSATVSRNTMKPVIQEQITTLKLVSQVAKAAGRDTSQLDQKIGKIETSFTAFGDANIYLANGLGQYNTNLRVLQNLMPRARDDAAALKGSFEAQQRAIQSVNKQAEVLIGLRKQLAGKQSVGEQFSSAYKASATGLRGIGVDGNTIAGKFMTKEFLNTLKSQLGFKTDDTTLDNMSVENIAKLFDTRGKGFDDRSRKAATDPAKAQEALNKGLQSYLPSARAKAQVDKQLADIAHKRFLNEKLLKDAADANIELSPDKVAALKAENKALKTQSDLVKQNFSDIGRMGDALGTSIETGLTNSLQGLIEGTMSVKEAFASMAQSVVQAVVKVIAELMAIKLVKTMFGNTAFGDFLGIEARYGGVFSGGKAVQGYSAGGIAKGKDSGYPAVLHGTEAVVPLPNGKSIPVDIKGSGGQVNNVVVNVSSDGRSNVESSSGFDMENMGKAVALAVQKELQAQKRSGGILSPYGAA